MHQKRQLQISLLRIATVRDRQGIGLLFKLAPGCTLKKEAEETGPGTSIGDLCLAVAQPRFACFSAMATCGMRRNTADNDWINGSDTCASPW